MKDIAIYGAGGFGREVACLINSINQKDQQWNFIGFFDDGVKAGVHNHFGKVLGNIELLNNWKEELFLVIAVGSPHVVKEIYSKINNTNVNFPNLLSPDLVLLNETSLNIGKGNVITCNCVISTDVVIGDFNIFNIGVVIGHDSKIGSFNVFNPSTHISGEITIGNENFFGVCSVVLQKKKIGNNTIIGANSVIIRNTQDNFLYLGNPATKMNY